MQRIHECWFSFYLENCSSKCKAISCKNKMYKDFVLALVILHRMLSTGFHSTEEIFFALSKFCISTNLIFMFKVSICACLVS
jgi:hypothetical protein